MRRTLILFGTLLLLWALVGEVNHLIAGWQIYLFVGSLYVSFAALTQPLRSGLAATLLGGLVCDANSPVIFGTHLLLFAAAHLTLLHVRDRVPRDDAISITLVVLLTNFALFVVFSIGQVHESPALAAIWGRLVIDLVCSQVLIAIVTPWFFALQARSLELARVTRSESA